MAQQWKIENGPSKFDLMMALFDRNSRNPRSIKFSGVLRHKETGAPFVPFSGKELSELEAEVISIGIEDGSGDSWTLLLKEKNGQLLSGHYRTDHRKGYLETQPDTDPKGLPRDTDPVRLHREIEVGLAKVQK